MAGPLPMQAEAVRAQQQGPAVLGLSQGLLDFVPHLEDMLRGAKPEKFTVHHKAENEE